MGMEKVNGNGKSLFQPAENQSAFLKLSIMGFAGSGKTFTSGLIALGMSKMLKSKKPVFFIDTEKGSDFLVKRFQDAKVPLQVSKTRAFSDLVQGTKYASENGSFLIIDSVSHFWKELVSAFMKKKQISRMAFHHWGPVKEEWAEFTTLFVNAPLHIIACGRAGYEYEMEKDDDGVKEISKSGVKMLAEGQFGYEADLAIQMEAARNLHGGSIHKAIIWKDRADVLDGQVFENPTFETFMPHIKFLNIGGDHQGVNVERTSQDMFEKGDSKSDNSLKREILLEKIDAEITRLAPGRTKEDTQKKRELSQDMFGTTSWKEITVSPLEKLQEGLKLLTQIKEEVVA